MSSTNTSKIASIQSLSSRQSSPLSNYVYTPIISNLLEEYDENLQRNISANEKNEQARQQYITDVIYIIFKVIMFVILGFFYYLFIRTPQGLIDGIKGTTEIVKETSETAAKVIKDKITEVKPETNKVDKSSESKI
jgi:hypothetical protein